MRINTLFTAIFLFITLTSLISVSTHYNNDIWKILLKVKYSFKDNKYTPRFTPQHKALDRQAITISGYMYPLEESKKHQYFMLSYYPVKVCFFCGGAGAAAILKRKNKKPLSFIKIPGHTTPQPILFRPFPLKKKNILST